MAEPNPYRDWLEIQYDSDAPTFYELFGLPNFTNDTNAIQLAYEKAYQAARRYEVGNYSSEAEALIRELSDAYKCLTSPEDKIRYDDELRGVLSTRSTATDSEDMLETLVELVDQAVNADDDPLGLGSFANVDQIGDEFDAESEGKLVSQPDWDAPVWSQPTAPNQIDQPSRDVTSGPLLKPVQVFVMLSVVCLSLVVVLAAVGFALRGGQDDVEVIASSVQEEQLRSDDASDATVDEPDPVEAASLEVQWSGRLARVLIDQRRNVHLLVDSLEQRFEATSNDPQLLDQLSDYTCVAEHEQMASVVTIKGDVLSNAERFFDLENNVESGDELVPVVQLREIGLERIETDESMLNEEDKRTLKSLRTIGSFTNFDTTVRTSLDSDAGQFQVSFHGREFSVEVPPAWQALAPTVAPGQSISLVVRTTGDYALLPSTGRSDAALLLQVDTINQPDFQEIQREPLDFVGQSLIYQAEWNSSSSSDDLALVLLTLRNAGASFPIKGYVKTDQQRAAFLNGLKPRDPVLVEFEVTAATGSANPYKIVSLTRLNDAATRARFDNITIADSVPEVAKESPAMPEPVPVVAQELSDLPKHVKLPPVSSQVAEVLYPLSNAVDLQVELINDWIALDESFAFVANKVLDGEAVRWKVCLRKTVGDESRELPVAVLIAGDHELAFRWLENEAELPVGQLRNCRMRLVRGDESHEQTLRIPLQVGPLDLSNMGQDSQLEFELLDLPSEESLRLDIDLAYEGVRVESKSGTNTTTRGRRLDFKIGSLSEVEVQAALLARRDGTLVLQLIPRHQLTNNRQLVLSEEEVNDLERRIQQSAVKAQRAIAKAQNMLSTASNALSRASGSATRAKFGAIVRTQQKAIATNQRSLSEIQRTLGSIGELRDLASTLRRNTHVRYRIYAESGAGRLLLVDGGFDQLDTVESEVYIASAVDGTWQPSSMKFRGREIPLPNTEPLRLAGGQYFLQQGTTVTKGGYEVDTSQVPFQISFDVSADAKARTQGVYLQSGNFALSDDGNELRLTFTLDGSSPNVLTNSIVEVVYRRVE